jgi:GNAT superfamily N-acetyltransferase
MPIATTATSPRIMESPTSKPKEVLLAHTVSTKCVDAVVTDNAMGLPAEFDPSSERYQDPKLRGWRSSNPSPSLLGHQEAGQTLGLHSLGVLPAYQGKGFGKTILKAYIQRMGDTGVARRIALITHERLINFYKNFGFIYKGRSRVSFGGGDWHDMVRNQNRTCLMFVFQAVTESALGT